MEQKNILCFGDSNTHGYNSKTGGRFTVEERWTKLLQRKLGDDYYVIEEGLSGPVSYTHLNEMHCKINHKNEKYFHTKTKEKMDEYVKL